MSKIKLTKGELKKQRDSLKQFRHYLPTLQLKKQQLQMKILESRRALAEKESRLKLNEKKIDAWIGLLADPCLKAMAGADFEIKKWVVPAKISLSIMNIAGANVPFLNRVEFKPADYDYYTTPLWVDKVIEDLQIVIKLLLEVNIFKKQIQVLENELRVTTQRVNLFEKIKIPECIENIRTIRIYLGDQQANAVGISKVAKSKILQTAGI